MKIIFIYYLFYLIITLLFIIYERKYRYNRIKNQRNYEKLT